MVLFPLEICIEDMYLEDKVDRKTSTHTKISAFLPNFSSLWHPCCLFFFAVSRTCTWDICLGISSCSPLKQPQQGVGGVPTAHAVCLTACPKIISYTDGGREISQMPNNNGFST